MHHPFYKLRAAKLSLSDLIFGCRHMSQLMECNLTFAYIGKLVIEHDAYIDAIETRFPGVNESRVFPLKRIA